MYHLKKKEVINMNGKEFLKAVNLLEEEKKIPRDYIFETMEAALRSAYKKNFDSK